MTRARDVATQGGMVLLANVSISASSTLTIDNVFTSAYENYKVVINGVATAITGFNMYFRTSGSSPSTIGSDYNNAHIRVNSGGTVNSNVGTTNRITLTDLYTSQSFTSTLDIMSPFSTTRTFVRGFSDYLANGDYYTNGAADTVARSIGGFLISQNNSGNFAATARVYGYRNA